MGAHTIACLKRGETLIDGIQESGVSPGLTHFLIGGDNSAYNRMVSINEQRPTARFTTVKVAAAITALGLTGLAIGATPLEIWFNDFDNEGSRKTTGEKINVTGGIVAPRTLDAEQGAIARIAYELVMAESDGTVPFTATSAQTVPTGADVDESFRLGDVTVYGASIGPVLGVSIDWGFVIKTIMGNDSIFPVLVAIEHVQPRITIRTLKPEALVAVGASGTDDLWEIELLANEQGGGLAGVGDKVFSTHLNHSHVESLSGTYRGEAVTTIMVEPIFDGTNAPITVA